MALAITDESERTISPPFLFVFDVSNGDMKNFVIVVVD